MNILTHSATTVKVGDTYLVIDKHTGFVTILRQGETSNVVGRLPISELRQALGLHALGFATPEEQTEDRRNEIISAVRFATSKPEFDQAMAAAYGFDSVLTGMLQKEYGYKWR